MRPEKKILTKMEHQKIFLVKTEKRIQEVVERGDDALMAIDVLQYNFKTNTSNTYFCGSVIFAEGKPKEARFFKSDEYTAKKIWEETSNLQHVAILKLWFVTYCGPLQCWIICYDRFEHLLDSWLKRPNIDTLVRKSDDLLHPNFSPTISMLLDGVIYLHKHDLFHMGLDKTSNYVVVSNQVMIINIGMLSIPERVVQHDDDMIEVNNLRVKDFMAMKELLKRILKKPQSWIQRDTFLAFFDLVKEVSYDRFIRMLLAHPFMMTTADVRMSIFFNVMRARDVCHRKYMINFDEALKNERFQEYSNWTDACMGPQLRAVFHFKDKYGRKSNYDGRNMRDLLNFLRNAYWHPQCSTMEQLDHCVRTVYVDFLNRIYEVACRIYDVEMSNLKVIN